MIGTANSQVRSDVLGGIDSESGIGIASDLPFGGLGGGISGDCSFLINSVSGIGTATSSGNKFLFTLLLFDFFLGGNGGGTDGSGVETIGSVWFASSGISGTVARLFLVAVGFLVAVVGDVKDDEHGGKLAAESPSGGSCSVGTISIKKSNISL